MQQLAIVWGLGGVLLLLSSAFFRLSPLTAEALSMELTAVHWAFLSFWLPFMAYSEGYKGFQLKFSPRVVARAWHLSRAPRPLHLLFAPVFCMGYFHASRRRKITSWAISVGIVGLVALVKLLPQPWRGLVDLGVLLGLGWGALAIVILAIQALRRGGISVDPQLPEGVESLARA